jgi:hypothetical protein
MMASSPTRFSPPEQKSKASTVTTNGFGSEAQSRVARCYIFKPKIPIWGNFRVFCNGRCLYILVHLVYFWSFGIFGGFLVPRQVWQPWLKVVTIFDAVNAFSAIFDKISTEIFLRYSSKPMLRPVLLHQPTVVLSKKRAIICNIGPRTDLDVETRKKNNLPLQMKTRVRIPPGCKFF